MQGFNRSAKIWSPTGFARGTPLKYLSTKNLLCGVTSEKESKAMGTDSRGCLLKNDVILHLRPVHLEGVNVLVLINLKFDRS